MTNRYKILPKARADLEKIWLYGVNQWGLAQAERYLAELEQSFQFIAQNPELCRERHEFTPPVRIYHQGRHLIIYHLNDDCSVIIRILHDRMNVGQHIESDSLFIQAG